MSNPKLLQPILFQNTDQDVTLIDIPVSIAAAQDHDVGYSTILYSSPPLQDPYPTHEPKSPHAKEKLVNNTVDEASNAVYKTLIEKSLSKIKSSYTAAWCLPRIQAPSIHTEVSHSSRECDKATQTMLDDDTVFEELQSSISCNFSLTPTACDSESQKESSLLWDQSLHNPYDSVSLVKYDVRGSSVTFRIPPRSSFLFGDCANSTAFRTAVRNMSQDYDIQRHFDFILLDPPWPNASVKRKKCYKTQRSLNDIKRLILRMDLDMYMASGAIIGIWITNKPAVRSVVLGRGGLFEKLGLTLVEEWIWVKTTIKGEPVTSLEGTWRKPYEVLLLAKAPLSSWQEFPEVEVRQRVIAGVPDMHSRKPCLKSLIEPFMPDPKNYSALEIFSRHLVAGWWSWGDEAFKFNRDTYWADGESRNSSSVVASKIS